jgi:hypothetical protein
LFSICVFHFNEVLDMKVSFAPALKKAFSFLGGLAALLFVACDSTTTLNSGDLLSTVTIYVLDVRTGLPLEDVRVDLLGVGAEKTDGGHVNFKDVKAGTYFVRLSKKGYESSQTTITSEVQGTETVVAVNYSATLGIHKLGAKVKGRVLIRSPKGDSTKAAKNATVNLFSSPMTDGIFLNAVRTVKTDTNGWYTFENLAEYADYAVEVADIKVGDRTYRQEYTDIGNDPLISTSPTYMAPVSVLFPSTAGNLTVYSLGTRLVKGQPFVLEFSNPIDTAELVTFPLASIQLRVTPTFGGITTIAASLAWNADHTKLSIMPLSSDWVDGSTYMVNLSSVQDIYGDAVSTSFTDLTVPAATVALGAVTNVRLRANTSIRGTIFDTTIVDYATTPYRLSWNKVAGAEGYSVLYRQGTDSAWQLRVTTTGNTANDTTVTLAPTALTGKAWTRYLMVLPNSSTQPVPYSLGGLMTVKDGVRPSLNVAGSAITAPGGTSFNNTTGTAQSITLTLGTFLTGSQNDPIDTTKKPTIRVGNGGVVGTFPAPTFRWTSLTGGTLSVTVPANTSGVADTVVVDFSTVTDLAGNFFDNLPVAPVLRYLAP